jgi:hypothetical protein
MDHSRGEPKRASVGTGLFPGAFGQSPCLAEAEGFFPLATPDAATSSTSQPPTQSIGRFRVTR